MFPDFQILGLDLYVILITIGILAALFAYRKCADKLSISSKVFNFTLITIILTIVVGYFSAILFQMFYNYNATGVWEVKGATFYGGLIGGAVFFLLFYFLVGHFVFKNKDHLLQMPKVVSSVITCVVLAHGFGRLGCLFVGCCYGKETDAWYGMNQIINGSVVKVIPTQLFEALFLFALFAIMLYLLLKVNHEYHLPLYLVGYGVWRFLIEYARGDDARGESPVSWLSPSQFTAIFMFIAGVALYFVYKYYLKNLLEKLEQKHLEQFQNETDAESN